MKIKTIFINILLLSTCNISEVDFVSTKLISTTGETIYINSLNWGVTGDSQLSAVTHSKDKGRSSRDSLDGVYGLEPFFYSFDNDTLTLYFDRVATYRVKEKFKSIFIQYKVVHSDELNKIRYMASKNRGYYGVPKKRILNYPKDMPEP